MKTAFTVVISLLLVGACATTPPPDAAIFASIQPGLTTRDQLMRQLGSPASTTYLPLRDLTVWSYKYKESGVWDSVMHIHMDKLGVVRELQSGPDPDKEERHHF